MPSKLTCFWIEPSNEAEVSLRRWRSDSSSDVGKCPALRVPYPGHPAVAWGYHNAEVKVDRCARGEHDTSRLPTVDEQADPRWPKKCDCGYEFAPTDNWYISTFTLYRRVDTNELYTLHDAPAGAMYDAYWYGEKKGPDGKNVILKTPEGEWWIDGPANNGPGWTRVGEVPRITCTPSIGIGTPYRMHGWLRNGVLEIDFP